MNPSELENFLHQHIPASAALGISVLHCDQEKVELSAPLSINRNHKSTAFGGSLSVIAIMSAWSLVHMHLHDLDCDIVIQESSMNYLQPANNDFSSVSMKTDEVAWQKFIRMFEKRGKGRITVNSDLYCAGEKVAEFTGTYVAVKLAV